MNSNNWEWKTIGDLFQIGAGKTMSATSRGNGNKVPFLRTSNVFWDEIDLSVLDEMVISEEELSSKSLKKGDLLVCEGGDIGRAAIWEGQIERISFQNHLHRLRPIAEILDPRFYVFYLQCGFTQLGIFEGAGNRTTIPNLSSNRLAALPVPVPPFEEQKTIVHILALARSGIQIGEQAIAKAQELKRASMRELFTRGSRNETQKTTSIGNMPESWTVRNISDLCIIRSGGTPHKSEPSYWEGDVPWVSGKDLKHNRLRDVVDHITPEAAARFSQIAEAGSVLVLVRGMGLANSFALSLIERPMAFNQDLKSLSPIKDISGPFLMHSLLYSGPRMLKNLSVAAHGTKTLTLEDIASFEIPLPCLDEQREIVEILDAIDRKIELHKRKKALLEELFTALLHKLMTGEIRVEDLDLSALENGV